MQITFVCFSSYQLLARLPPFLFCRCLPLPLDHVSVSEMSGGCLLELLTRSFAVYVNYTWVTTVDRNGDDRPIESFGLWHLRTCMLQFASDGLHCSSPPVLSYIYPSLCMMDCDSKSRSFFFGHLSIGS